MATPALTKRMKRIHERQKRAREAEIRASRAERRRTTRIVPTIAKLWTGECSLCDHSKATKYRLPACARPARWIVLDSRLGVLSLCDHHVNQAQRDVTKQARDRH